MILNLIEFLRGKKTYIIAGLMIALGFLTGDNKMIMDGLAFATLRAGVSAGIKGIN